MKSNETEFFVDPQDKISFSWVQRLTETDEHSRQQNKANPPNGGQAQELSNRNDLSEIKKGGNEGKDRKETEGL